MRNRIVSVTDPLNNTATFAYDLAGNKVSETNALNQTTTYAYDALNRMVSQTDPAGHVTQFAFDAVGNKVSVTDANNHTTTYTYNSRNWLSSETDAQNITVSYGYNPVGNKTSVTDGKGATWNYTFDYAGRETSMTQPDATIERKVYDGNGNLLAKQKPDGNVIAYDYDKLNRLTKKDYPTGTDTTFVYDALGRRTQMVDSTGTTTWAYDALGRVISVTQPCGAVNKEVTYSYDVNGNRLTMTDPDGGVQSYVYDADNRLTSTTAPNAGTTSYQYDALGRVTRQDNGNGTYTLNTFDNAGNLTLLENHKSDGTILSSFAYTVDNVGNRLSITEHVLTTDNSTYDDATVNYGYDNIYRLTSEYRTGAHPFWNEYTYDNAGNRLTLTQKDDAGNAIGTTNSVYGAANKLQSAGNISYTWDANGNQVAKTVGTVTTTYIWNYEDKMTQLHDGTTLNFTTDGDGFRRSLSSGGATTYFVYDRHSNTPGIAPLITETDAAGTTTARYATANGLFAQTRSGATHWYAYEGIGSTRQLSDNSQLVTDGYTYDAWGNSVATTGTTPNPFKYVGNYGYYDDGQSGLMLLGVRWYDAGDGRFIANDPLDWSPQRFAYVSDMPVTFGDPRGLCVGIYSTDVFKSEGIVGTETKPEPTETVGGWLTDAIIEVIGDLGETPGLGLVKAAYDNTTCYMEMTFEKEEVYHYELRLCHDNGCFSGWHLKHRCTLKQRINKSLCKMKVTCMIPYFEINGKVWKNMIWGSKTYFDDCGKGKGCS